MEAKIVIVIQDRMGSNCLPGKVMLPTMGESLLARMAERVQRVTYPVTLMIATSDRAEDHIIADEAKHLMIPYYRGSAGDLLDRHYQAAKMLNAQYVLKIPSDCPLIDYRIVDRALSYFFKPGATFDYVSNLHPATYPDGNDVEIMTMDCLERTWKGATKVLEREHTTPYIWENPNMFTVGNVEWETGLDYSMSHRFTVDYLKDYEFIKRVFEELYPINRDFSCEDILALLDKNPAIYAINSEYAGVNWYRNHCRN